MLTRAALVAGSMSTIFLAGSGIAAADSGWGGVDCGTVSYAGCQLGAGQDGHPGQAPPRPHRPGPGAGSESGSGEAPGHRGNGDQMLGDANLADCRYVPSDYHPPSQGTATVAYHPPQPARTLIVTPAVHRTTLLSQGAPQQQSPGQSGAWYVYQCSGQGWRDSLYRPPIWIPNGPTPAPLPSPETLAQQAYSQLRLPSPQIHASPAQTQLVNLPTWLWMDPAQWRPQSATASVPGVSVTATAVPNSVTWSMGDGSTVTCPGPGTPFPSSADPRSASDCGHTYHHTSQGRPGNAYPVAATVNWTVTWSGAGTGGTFPNLTTTSTASFAVAEAQALNNTPR
ncbi:hypothetical protein [Saccharopolyspora rosea]|uniref:ATP/GTP-binding protein n=1 Tax=Saccharopolyspora rosea TaxID=524884 RepID=A0ABW3FXN1_9PSEU|nr:hypothetical protein [Saccharopolyspora rosea]